MLDLQQRTDVQMLARLRHNGFVRRNDQHHEIDAADAGEHVLDKFFVAGNIDEPDAGVRIQCEVRETDIDRNAPLFLFFKAVGIDSGESFNQRRFTVIDVSGGSYDNVRHRSSCTNGNGSPITLK